jgi:hypothetical protein
MFDAAGYTWTGPSKRPLNDFQQSFARMSAGSFFKEPFRANGMTYEATGIEEILESTKLAMGGALATATTTLRVTEDTHEAASLGKGVIVEARGDSLRIISEGKDGAGNWTLHCEAANQGRGTPALR